MTDVWIMKGETSTEIADRIVDGVGCAALSATDVRKLVNALVERARKEALWPLATHFCCCGWFGKPRRRSGRALMCARCGQSVQSCR